MKSIIGGFISIMIAVLIIVQAVLPAVSTAVADSNFTGTTKTMVDMYPWFIAIAGLLFILGGVGLAR